jgi:hypothetical protein
MTAATQSRQAVTVTLTWHEAAMASEVGRLRQLAAIRAGRPDRHGFSGLGWDAHVEGACGELSVAKVLGRYWDGSVDTFKSPDLPGGVQVRTRSKHDWELLIRPCDPREAVYVLVTGRCPSYRVHGWIQGSEAMRQEWLANHAGRPPAYFIPQEALLPLTTLPAVRHESRT